MKHKIKHLFYLEDEDFPVYDTIQAVLGSLWSWTKILKEVSIVNITLIASFRAFPTKSVVDNPSFNSRSL